MLACNETKGGSEGDGMEVLLEKVIENIMNDFPEEYDIETVMKKYPVVYGESMNTVLTQELTRFNKLIAIIRSSLKDIKLALKGKILLSQILERASK